MNIGKDSWLETAIRKPIPGGTIIGTSAAPRRFLVIHHTAGASAQSSIDWWKSPEANGACAHVVIDRDGTIYQCRPFNRTAGHAGNSSWVDPHSGTRYFQLNSCSLGIELANAGPDSPGRDAFDWAKKQMGFRSVWGKHKNGGPVCEWECFPPAQLAACEMLSKLLVERYNLDDVVGHEDISRGRKIDPGPAFPMKELRAACGFTQPLP